MGLESKLEKLEKENVKLKAEIYDLINVVNSVNDTNNRYKIHIERAMNTSGFEELKTIDNFLNHVKKEYLESLKKEYIINIKR